MTGSWLIDYFIYGCVVLVLVPAIACIYQAINKKNGRGE